MDIPDEAIRAAAQARLGPSPRLEDLLEGHLAYELNMAEEQVEAAAPHIARAAQVQILRKLADEWATDEIGTSGDTVERETWWMAIGELRAEAEDLEQS